MENLRFIGTALALFVAMFLGVRWWLAPRDLKPDPRLPTFHQVDVNDPRTKFEQSFASDNDAVRDQLRHEVLDYAKALKDDPCNDTLKTNYIRAAIRYAQAWLSIAHCVGTSTCTQSDNARLDQAQKAFGSPLDHRAREAMRAAHDTVAFQKGDFPGDVARLVAQFASDARINPLASPEIAAQFEEFRQPASCRAAMR
jgi:hypothetical protein